jgi:glycosyltransferase involved in cell wall biosynthesis
LKILWHSNAPFTHTGYAQQTAIFAPLLREAGHEVVISAFHGLNGPPADWNGIKVLCSQAPGDPFGTQMLAAHFAHEKADLVITLCDIWVLAPDVLAGLPVAHWLPVDCEPLSVADRICLDGSGAQPVAMSRFGQRMLHEGGFPGVPFVPHGLHPAYRDRRPDREAAREHLGVTGKFAIGINAATKDPYRKAMAEQYAAFARLHEAHPDTALLVHGLIKEPGGLDLQALERTLSIPEGAVRYVDQYAYLSGQVPVSALVAWYSALDLYSGCAMGEGFGIPIIEAQSQGVPVVVTDASAMTELCGAGWKVGGEPFWNVTHRSWWTKPDVGEIREVYETAYLKSRDDPGEYGAMRQQARGFATWYHADQVMKDHWVPALAELEQRLVTSRPA